MRVVFDANVAAAGAVGHPGSPLTELISRWFAREFAVVPSDENRDEIERTLGKRYFATRMSIFERRHFLTLLDQRSEHIVPTVWIEGVAPHPEDDRVLEAAVSAGMDYLVAGDRGLQRLGEYAGIPILDARALRDYLGGLPPD